jgi:hypothetical protein
MGDTSPDSVGANPAADRSPGDPDTQRRKAFDDHDDQAIVDDNAHQSGTSLHTSPAC